MFEQNNNQHPIFDLVEDMQQHRLSHVIQNTKNIVEKVNAINAHLAPQCDIEYKKLEISKTWWGASEISAVTKAFPDVKAAMQTLKTRIESFDIAPSDQAVKAERQKLPQYWRMLWPLELIKGHYEQYYSSLDMIAYLNAYDAAMYTGLERALRTHTTRTAIDLVMSGAKPPEHAYYEPNLLHRAVMEENSELVQAVIEKHPAMLNETFIPEMGVMQKLWWFVTDVVFRPVSWMLGNLKPKGTTAFHLATALENSEIQSVLRKNGCDITIQDLPCGKYSSHAKSWVLQQRKAEQDKDKISKEL